MASFVTINLDTRAPEVEFGDVIRPLPNQVIIPYEISPDTEDLSAELQIIGGEILPVTITDDEFVINGVPDDALGLRLRVEADDDVLNHSLTSYDFMISIFEVFGRLKFTKVFEASLSAGPIIGSSYRRSKLFGAEISRRTVLAIKARAQKILDATMKRDDGRG